MQTGFRRFTESSQIFAINRYVRTKENFQVLSMKNACQSDLKTQETALTGVKIYKFTGRGEGMQPPGT